jgi:hypothetical protein
MIQRILAALVPCIALTACEPPAPTLATLSSPVITAQRRMGKELLVVVTYDDKKTPCGTVTGLHATLDGSAMGGSAGARNVDQMTGAVTCEFPNFAINPANGTMPRQIVITDDVHAIKMTIDTLDVGSANAESPPATLHSGNTLRFLASPPAAGTSSYKVDFTPQNGAPAVWTEGASLPSSVSVTVPTVPTAASGTIALSWVVNTMVTLCEGAASCAATIQGASTVPAVVAP